MIQPVMGADTGAQDDIIRQIERLYLVKIERKAVGRHLQLLEEMHFDVKRCRGGACK